MVEWIAAFAILAAAWLLSRAQPVAALCTSLLALPYGLYLLAASEAGGADGYAGLAVLNAIAWDRLLGELVPALLLIFGPPLVWLLSRRRPG